MINIDGINQFLNSADFENNLEQEALVKWFFSPLVDVDHNEHLTSNDEHIEVQDNFLIGSESMREIKVLSTKNWGQSFDRNAIEFGTSKNGTTSIIKSKWHSYFVSNLNINNGDIRHYSVEPKYVSQDLVGQNVVQSLGIPEDDMAIFLSENGDAYSFNFKHYTPEELQKITMPSPMATDGMFLYFEEEAKEPGSSWVYVSQNEEEAANGLVRVMGLRNNVPYYKLEALPGSVGANKRIDFKRHAWTNQKGTKGFFISGGTIYSYSTGSKALTIARQNVSEVQSRNLQHAWNNPTGNATIFENEPPDPRSYPAESKPFEYRPLLIRNHSKSPGIRVESEFQGKLPYPGVVIIGDYAETSFEDKLNGVSLKLRKPFNANDLGIARSKVYVSSWENTIYKKQLNNGLVLVFQQANKRQINLRLVKIPQTMEN